MVEPGETPEAETSSFSAASLCRRQQLIARLAEKMPPRVRTYGLRFQSRKASSSVASAAGSSCSGTRVPVSAIVTLICSR